jgi:serine carboxypeptidase 1
LPEFKKIPLYIFCESYGGKMAAAFSELLYKAVSSGSVTCDFRGVALGDSWISPVDSIMTWGPYLYATSLVDETGLTTINKAAVECAEALARGDGKKATELWYQAQLVTGDVTDGVNWYNILLWGAGPSRNRNKIPVSYRSNVGGGLANDWLRNLFELHVGVMQFDDLSILMNGPIKKKLGIIPDNVTWGGQALSVFVNLSEDFMKPVVDIVDLLLNSTKLDVVVYNGQLDLIVDTLGTERWVQRLKWSDLPSFNSSQRISYRPDVKPGEVAGYFKTYKNFSFYWILDAGHMIPLDSPDAALWMLKKVIHVK